MVLPHIPGLELQERVGEGGMGVVYRAVHLNLQRTVAVKVLHERPAEGTARPAWQRESRAMALLAHPNVVVIHDAGQIDGHNYLVLEYMAGGSLRSRMRPGQPWSLKDAVAAIDSISQALCHIHALGVLHLDLKPENILFTSDGQMKITDFGLSVSDAGANRYAADGAGAGTIDYCAPEQRFGLGLDARCDVFSLAAIAYELLTGRPPGRVYVPVSRRCPQLSPALDDVLRCGLARDPSERYDSVRQFRDATVRACQVRPAGRWRWKIAIAASLVAVTVALSAFHVWSSGAREQAVGPEVSGESFMGASQPVVPPQDGKAAGADWSRSSATDSGKTPTELWFLYDSPGDLSLFGNDKGGDWPIATGTAVQRVLIERPGQSIPSGLPLADWTTCRPTLIVRSPDVWGFIHPVADQTLGKRVVRNWPALLYPNIRPEENHVKAGNFEEGSLSSNHRGNRWRIGDVADWKASRQISLAVSPDEPGNLALAMTNLDPARTRDLLGCYQPLEHAPPPGAVTVLRYRARSQLGKGALTAYLGMSVRVPEKEAGDAAMRIRKLGVRLPPSPENPATDGWVFRVPNWVVPSVQWQTYIVVFDAPPFAAQSADRNLIIDMSGTDQIWVDDVSLFAWQPEGKP